MKHKVLFTSDLHGNERQYKKLIDHAIRISADFIIIGGDIAPKRLTVENFIEAQRDFIKNRLSELISRLKQELPNSKIFLMMGNDDCAANMDVLDNSKLYNVIHGIRTKLTKEFDIVGYSYVPITPFGIKDWEKFDLSEVSSNLKEMYEHRKKTNYRLDGFKSTKLGFMEFEFDSELEKLDSIQKDLANDIVNKKSNKILYVFHTPPNKTKLDMSLGKRHLGSFAVREFIEKNQPYLTLHGHIHETVDVSKKFKDKIGNTLCLSSGNDNLGRRLAVLVFDLENPQDAKRIIL